MSRVHRDLRESLASQDLLDQLDLVARTVPQEEMVHLAPEVNEERMALLDNLDKGIKIIYLRILQ